MGRLTSQFWGSWQRMYVVIYGSVFCKLRALVEPWGLNSHLSAFNLSSSFIFSNSVTEAGLRTGTKTAYKDNGGASISYSIVRKKKSSRKNPENSGTIPKMGVRRARSARRTPIFGIFPDFLEFSGICFPYNTVRRLRSQSSLTLQNVTQKTSFPH